MFCVNTASVLLEAVVALNCSVVDGMVVRLDTMPECVCGSV